MSVPFARRRALPTGMLPGPAAYLRSGIHRCCYQRAAHRCRAARNAAAGHAIFLGQMRARPPASWPLLPEGRIATQAERHAFEHQCTGGGIPVGLLPQGAEAWVVARLIFLKRSLAISRGDSQFRLRDIFVRRLWERPFLSDMLLPSFPAHEVRHHAQQARRRQKAWGQRWVDRRVCCTAASSCRQDGEECRAGDRWCQSCHSPLAMPAATGRRVLAARLLFTDANAAKVSTGVSSTGDHCTLVFEVVFVMRVPGLGAKIKLCPLR